MNEKYKFSIDEVQALYRGFKNEWINRDDDELQKVVDKISRIVNHNERLAKSNCKSA